MVGEGSCGSTATTARLTTSAPTTGVAPKAVPGVSDPATSVPTIARITAPAAPMTATR